MSTLVFLVCPVDACPTRAAVRRLLPLSGALPSEGEMALASRLLWRALFDVFALFVDCVVRGRDTLFQRMWCHDAIEGEALNAQFKAFVERLPDDDVSSLQSFADAARDRLPGEPIRIVRKACYDGLSRGVRMASTGFDIVALVERGGEFDLLPPTSSVDFFGGPHREDVAVE